MKAQKDTVTGKWYIQYRYTDWQGIRKKSTKRGFKTKREAEEWLRNFLLTKQGDLNMQFGDFLKMYYSDMKNRLRENTLRTKKYIIDLKVLPYFGKLKMGEIRPADIRIWQDKLIMKGYSATYLKTINNQLNAVFNYAVKYYDLRSNPCSKAGSMGKSKAGEMQFWTKEEFMRFIDCVMDKRQSYIAFMTLYWTGMRVGELLALTPKDIDLEKQTISITKSYQRIGHKDVITPPKTPKSKRVISIPMFLTEDLKDYIGSIYEIQEDDRLFPVTKYFLEHEMQRGIKLSGVKRIRIHDLRHSHASLLIEMGFTPLAIAGYCNGTVTIKNVYVTGNVSGGSYIGGLFGYINNSNSTISNSCATGEVSGSSYIGGFIGYLSGATVYNSYAIEKVTGSSNYVGGLIGENTGTIKNCYENSSVKGESYVGGIAGYNNQKIINSYAAGSVSGSQTVGCFVGYNYYGTVTDGYWQTAAQMSGYGSNYDGSFTATEMTAADMQTQKFADTLNANINSLDLTFCTHWKYYSGVNSGFPVLQGVGAGDISSDKKAPTIEARAYQNYNDGSETLQTTIVDEGSGVAIQKYASDIRTVSYFATNGTSFTSPVINGLTVGTYTIYAKDNAGNETVKVIKFNPVKGSGTSSDPYIITTATQLGKVTTGLGKYYKLGNDIDLSNYGDWIPIGSNTAPFKGYFDGSGYTISSLTIGTLDKPSTLSYQGLFGAIYGATIKNLHINVSIYSSSYDIGGITGYCSGSAKITNISVTGNVSGSSYVGGLVGNIPSSSAEVTKSYAKAKVSGTGNYIGGLIGQNVSSVINCYANGDVSGKESLGGLVGQNRGTTTNCYTTGNVDGVSGIGGFVGSNSGKVINSYASGNTSGSSSTGGFVGNNSGSVIDGYWNTTARADGYGSSSGTFEATGMALADMESLAFANTLSMNIDDLNISNCVDWKYVKGTPVLQGVGDGVATKDTTPPTIVAYEYQNYATGKEEIHANIYDDNSGIAIQKVLAGEHSASSFADGGTVFTGTTIKDLTVGTYTIYAKDNAGNESVKVVKYSSASGNGTTSNPYIITTAGQLAAIPTGLGKSYKLGCNIDLSSYKNWTPIGSSTGPFTGIFDGNGYTITNLKIGSSQVPSSLSYLGLFGIIDKATIKNVTVNSTIYSTGDYIGGLVGKSLDSSTIADTYTLGTVSGNSYVGGLVGYNSSSTINSSSAKCTVSSNKNYAGGLVGSNVSSSSILNSYSSGNVSGTSIIGGFVGNNNGTLTNSYETGNASGTSNIGGFVGTNSGTIINSYEAGGVTGHSNVSGFTGSNSGTLTDCYYNSSSNSEDSPSVTGMSLSSMKKQAFADKLNSNISDLDNSNCMEWDYDEDSNSGLPYLSGVPVVETGSDGTTIVKVTNPDGSTDTKTYDGKGNLISDKNSKKGTTTYTYDDDGTLETKTDPNGTVTTYNTDGTVSNETDTDGNSIDYTYDDKGNLISKYDSKEGETTYDYYSNGVMKSETDPDGTVTNFNSEGVVASVKYPDGKSLTYTYDDNGKLATLNDSTLGITTFTYDSNGNLSKETTPDGTVVSCNSKGKPALATRTDGSTITYTYDSNGNLISTVDSKYGTTTYSYDSSGHRISETDPDGTVVTFDTDGKVEKATFSDGRTVSYEYNSSGNLSTSIDSLAGTSTYNYDDNQNLVSIKQPNGQSFYYDSDGSISSIQNSANNASAEKISYTYDSKTGNIVGIYEDDVLKVSYQYNSSNELVRENNAWLNESITYTYDENGNITGKSVYPYTTNTLGTAGKDYNYGYGNSSDTNQLTSYDGKTLTYDSNGNLTDYNGWAYTWDGSNLSGAKNTGNVVSYKYSSAGLRTSKTVNGVTTTYTLDKNNKITGETDGTNVLKFVYDTTGKLCYMTLNGEKYYYETDVQGDIIGLLDSNKNEVVTYQYDAWGKLINMDGSLASTVGIQNPFRYRGYYYDTETGLYYLQSRYYNPEISRFISRDGESYHKDQTGINANLYAYAINNPVMYGDSDGHSVTSMILNIASSVLSLVSFVNPITVKWKLIAAVGMGLVSLAVTWVDYTKSLNHLNEQHKAHKITDLVYAADIKTCNIWRNVGIGAAVITTIFTALGWNRFTALHSKLGYEVANALVGVFLGHALSNVMWVNDMVTLMRGDFSWF